MRLILLLFLMFPSVVQGKIKKPTRWTFTQLHPNTPKKFPKWKKCRVKGVRHACYDKQGAKRLLLLWTGFRVLGALPDVIREKDSQLQNFYVIIDKLSSANDLLRRSLKSKSKSYKLLREKLRQQERMRTWRTVGWVSGVVLAVAGGITIGYFVAKGIGP